MKIFKILSQVEAGTRELQKAYTFQIFPCYVMFLASTCIIRRLVILPLKCKLKNKY